MGKRNKEKNKVIKTSIIYWIVIFMALAAIFVPLIKDMKTWPDWLKILMIFLAVALPFVGQGTIIHNYLHKRKTPPKDK